MSASEQQLSEEELVLYKAAFAILDRDADGSVTVEELGALMRSLGKTATDAEVREMISEVDEDGNGRLEQSEFLTLMLRKISEVDAQEEVRDAFRIFDQDSDGFISAAELHQVMGFLGLEFSVKDAEDMLKEATSSKHQPPRLSYEEFNALVNLKK